VQQNLVTSAWETPQHEGQRPRKYYRLTGAGIEVARLELARLEVTRSSRPKRAAGPPGRLAPGSLG
jgi:PadR family transcriptional regulator PadR